MVEMSGILVGLIFVAAVTGLVLINDIGTAESKSDINSEITETSNHDLVSALNDMDSKIVSFFDNLKDELEFLNYNI